MNQNYPTPKDLDGWIRDIWQFALNTPVAAERSDDALLGMKPYFYTGHHLWKSRFVKLTPNNGEPFYVYWQPVEHGPAPLCAHLPGYGCEVNSHPDTVAMGYNVLDISPMGLCTPDGIDMAKREKPSMLPATILGLGREGYFHWLAQCIMAVLWAWKQPETLPDRVSFYGTSQGGGTALLMGSIFKGHGVRCVAADEPFLCNFPLAAWRCAYEMAKEPFEKIREAHGDAVAWRSLGYVDNICHAHRLTVPVLLTSGSADEICPQDTIHSLFDILPGTRAYMDIKDRSHGFTPEFIHLAWAWFRLYA